MKKLIGLVFLLSVVILSAQTENVTLHTVATGETLYSIARIYNVSPSSILLANGITDKEVKLQLNQKIKIPAKVFTNKAPKAAASPVIENARVANTPFSKEGDLLIHTVQKGETFYSIIRQYKVLAYDVISVNNLPNTLVKEGQKLILPSNATIPDIGDLPAPPAAKTEPVAPVKENIKSPVITKTEPAKPVTTLVAIEDNATRKNASSGGPVHTIAKGETIYAIGRMYGVSASEIMKLNNIKGDEYKVGQVLMIPKRNTNAAAATVVIKDTIPAAPKEKEDVGKEVIIAPAPVASIEKTVVKQEDSKTSKKPTPAKKEQK
jgi:LysM repeat protein